MMQVLPPPAPIKCVEAKEAASARIKVYIVASGDPAQLGEWLKEVRQRSEWTVDADVHSNGVRFARLSGDGAMPYREIGGLIYSGQCRQLNVTFQMVPPICEVEED